MDLTFLIRVAAVAMIFAFANPSGPTSLLGAAPLLSECDIYDMDGEDDCIEAENCDQACPPVQGCELDWDCYIDDDICSDTENWRAFYCDYEDL